MPSYDFSKYKTIDQFYQDTGLTPIEAYEFLKKECEQRGLL